MKALKWVVIVLVVLAGLILIIPIFLPSQAKFASEISINLSQEQIFQSVALYTNRDQWDPWLSMEPDAKVTISPNSEYVGSTYKWEGDKIGSGKMQVDSINYPDYIRSNIWFGDMPDPSVVEWNFNDNGNGTDIEWSFNSEGSYPFGRIMLLFMKKPMNEAFTSGLANLKSYLEENPPVLYELSEIKIRKSDPTNAMILPVEGNMEEIGAQMMNGYTELYTEITKQGLRVTGPFFAQYLDYDKETGFSHALLGVPVDKKGVKSGEMKPEFYDAAEAVSAIHYGKYEYFKESYEALESYVMENDIKVSGGAFEIYLKTMMESKNPMEWQTLIAFPIKK
jgi:effector-binding domain-containing protein